MLAYKAGLLAGMSSESAEERALQARIPDSPTARALWAYWHAHGHQSSLDAAQKVADLVLARRLLWHLGDGALIVPDCGGRPDRIHYPIQFYDLLFALEVMA